MTDKKINRPLEKPTNKAISEERLKKAIKEKKKALEENLTIQK